MNNLTTLLLILLALFNLDLDAQSTKNEKKLRRADCFFGVHFDLHASEDITNAGQTLTPEMIDTFLTKVRPDFIQIDCKGHPGISSYPTKVGFHVKGFEKDPLKLWREVTEKNKVALFMHFSGVWEEKVVKEHPDWAVVNARGEKSTKKVSFFSPYLDQYMIPQLKELSSVYKVDGAWVDGENWAVEPDFGEAAIKRWKAETGNNEVPSKPGDKLYPQYIDYTRSLFREHLRKYIDAIHAYNPNFQITSNWAYSSMMPEPVNTNVDFLSGDVTPQNGVLRSAFEARCLAPQGKPWDLMAWGFSWNGAKMPRSNKSSIQLKQEAAQIMAMGGGVQFYFQQNRDLSLKPWLATTLFELSEFCRQRQSFCHKATAIPQVALFFPAESYRQKSNSAFSGPPENLAGTLNSLLDNQLSVEILMEHHLAGKMNQYPLIIIPECDFIKTSFLDELRSYLQNGGNILVIGTRTAEIFAPELGIKSTSTSEEKTTFISAGNRMGSILSPLLESELLPGSQPLTHFYTVDDYASKSKTVASSLRQVGKGKIAAIYFNAGTAYSQYKTPVIRDFIAETIHELSPQLMVEVTGSHLAHVAVNQLKGKTFINLVNVAGEHTNQSAIGYDQVPALNNLTVSIKTLKKPSEIILQPEGRKMEFTYKNGQSILLIPKLEIHSILEITP